MSDYPTCKHCYITGDGENIVLCVLHAATDALLAFAERVDELGKGSPDRRLTALRAEARAVIRKAQGG